MLTVKKILSLLLVLSMVLTAVSALPVAALGRGSATITGFEEVELSRQDTSTEVDTGPSLAEGNYARWIDRIANLPDYAEDFYGWLTENSTSDGCLADPTKGTAVGGGYLYLATSVTASVAYTYTNAQSIQQAAENAVVAHAYPQFQNVMGYLSETFCAFNRDCPEVFWLSGTTRYSWGLSYEYSYGGGVGNATYYMEVYFALKTDDFDIRSEEYHNLNVLAAAIENRDADADRILADCPTNAPVAYQVRYLNRVLTQINSYNSAPGSCDSSDPWSCVSALAGSVGENGPVCEGYSKAFKLLCDRLGIDCVLVEGDAKSSLEDASGAHMWNYVCVDEQWYAVDVTWNDPVVAGADNEAISGYEREDWLLLGSDSQVSEGLSFIQSHPVTNVVITGGLDFSNGPVLSQDAYTFAENYMDITPYRGQSYTAPVKEGYLFAGWYADEALTKPISTETVSGWAYAKFLDEDTLTVKYQFTNGTTAQSASTDMRLLTSVDNLKYRSAGFILTLSGNTQTLRSNTVYEKVYAGSTLISNASAIFSPDANYFVTYTLAKIPQTVYDMSFVITPYWETLDGTVVEGTSRTFAISDNF